MNLLIKLIHLLCLILFLLFNSIVIVNTTCSIELVKCTSTVYPLLKDISYMFPSTKNEVDRMCSIWSNIVDCVRHYAKKCFDQKRKNSFNLAVGNSIGTVHSICVSDEVQLQYLNSSICLRDVSIKRCNLFFNQLIDVVTNPKAHDDHICCAYAKFRKCIDILLQLKCGEIVKNLMDHSLTVLIRKCGIINESMTDYDYCQIPSSLITSYFKQQRKINNQQNEYKENEKYYQINSQLINYFVKKNQENHQQSNEDTFQTDSTISNMNTETKNLDKIDDEFLTKKTKKFDKQNDEFEINKHRDYTAESPEYMMSHFSSEELHDNGYSLIFNFYLIYLPILMSVFVSKNF